MKLLALQDFVDLSSAFFPRASRRAERLLRRVWTRLSFARPEARLGPVATEPRPRRKPFSTTLGMLQLFATHPSSLTRPQRVRILGLEHLEAALARGKGVILWESPLGNSVIGKLALLHHGFSLVQVHGPEHGASRSWLGQKVIRRIHRRVSARVFEEVIDINYRSLAYLRRIQERLKANRIVCLRAFGQAGNKFILTRFRGETLYFPTGIMSLARQVDATLMAMFLVKDGQEERLVLSAPLPVHIGDPGEEGLIRLAAHYLAELRCLVERYPTQWWGVPKPPQRKRRLMILQVESEAEIPHPPTTPAKPAPRVSW